MKSLKLLFALFVTLAGFGDFSTDYIKISSLVMGPFSENSGAQNMNLTLYNSRTEIAPIRGVIKLKVENDELPQFTHFISSEITLTRKVPAVADIPLPTSFFFNGACRFTLSFEAQLPYWTIIDFEAFTISKKSIEINSLENALYENEKIGFQIVENQVIYKTEKYDFRGFPSELLSENYYRLELNQFYFVYESEKDFAYEKAFLSFEDPFDVFPLLEEDNERKIVPLKVNTLTDAKMQISFDKLYVEENYLWMSSTYKDGLASSKYFYLPLNAQEELFGLELRLSIIKAGDGQSDFHFDFEFYFGNNLFGDCHSSDFCLVGGVN